MFIYRSGNQEKYKFKSKKIIRKEKEYEPFVYIIKEISTGMLYIGSKTSKNCLESDLGTKYFTSSKRINWKNEVDKFEVIKIIKCFSNHDAIILESLKIKQHNAVWSDQYYNMYDPYIGFNLSGTKRSKETKEKISISNKKFYSKNPHHMKGKFGELHNNFGKIFSEEARTNMSLCKLGENHHYYNKKRSEKTKKKISESRKGIESWNKGKTGLVKVTQKTKRKISEANKNRTHSEETKRKMSLVRKGITKKQCPYCKNKYDPGNYKKYHGENCKLSP